MDIGRLTVNVFPLTVTTTLVPTLEHKKVFVKTKQGRSHGMAQAFRPQRLLTFDIADLKFRDLAK